MPAHDVEKDYQTIMEKTARLLQLPEDLVCSVIFVDPAQIHQINNEYRGIDRETDVISFALLDDRSNVLIPEEEKELGDIFINVNAIEEQASAYGHSPRRESCFLFCHGLLHLLGYDHMTPQDEEKMFGLQREILHEVADR